MSQAARATGVVLLAAMISGPACADSPTDGFEPRIRRALEHRGLRGAKLGVLVVRDADGTVLFSRSPDVGLAPASNLKILTALAALEIFGPAYRFTTRFYADAAPDAAGFVNRLAVQGGGDPTLTSEQWWRIAADLRLAGLRGVRGGILLDDSAFDTQGWNPEWGDVGTRAYHAPVSALSANYGSFAVEVRPGEKVSDPLRVAIDPSLEFLRLRNRGRTSAPGAASKLVVDRVAAEGFDRVSVSGSVPSGSEAQLFYRSVSDATRYAGDVLRMQLEANGIPVEGPVRRGTVADDAVLLLEFEGEAVGDIVRRFVKYSNNVVAESLLKGMGRHVSNEAGSWASGLAALRASLARLAVDTPGLHLVDGSGLARSNRVSPRTLVSALRRGRQSFRIGPEFVGALPIAGRDGTLQDRAEGATGWARAKTGLLDGVTALSGYACSPLAGELTFSILANGYKAADEEAMAALDGFLTALVADAGTFCQERLLEADADSRR